MVTMPSSEFRKRFASLIEDTYVTVNGHEIGMWLPRRTSEAAPIYASLAHGDHNLATETAKDPMRNPYTEFNPDTEFHPVPKSGQKGK